MIRVFPDFEQIANDSLSSLVNQCEMKHKLQATKTVGQQIANHTFHKYNSLVITKDIDL